jgi:hypothetical protein
MFCAAFAVDPSRVAVAVVLFFPDRETCFHLIDDVSTGIERLVPVRGRYAHPDRTIAYFEHTPAMDTVGMKNRNRGPRLGDDFFAFADGEGFIHFVFQPFDRVPIILVSDPAFESGIRTGRRIEEFTAKRGRVDRIVSDSEHVNPRLPAETAVRYHRR